MLALSPERPHPELDPNGYREELAALVARYRHVSLRELRLGPLLEEMTQISVRHHVGLPASLALVGKAFGQVQSTVAALDPTVDPFTVAEAFYLRQLATSLRRSVNPRAMLYEAQKLRVRAQQLLEGLERTVGARPGSGLEVQARGIHELERAIGHAGRRLALGLCGATALIATTVTATASDSPAWTIPAFGAASAVLVGGLLADVLRRR